MKHKLTRLTALMLAVILSFSTLLVPVQAASFTDVPEKAWYRKAVEYVSDKGWMNGVGEMTFAPTMNVTRGMFVTLLAAYADVDVDNSNAAFADTGAGKWYTGAAAWAAEQEIVKGIGSGQFAPNRSISRQDLCTMLYKYLQSAGIQLKADSDRTYADFSSVSPYAREAVAFCAASGLVTGFEDSTFRPKNTATRAQVAQILMRLDQLRQGEELPEDPMPAQSFEPVEAGEMTVSVEAPQGALPENTNMTVRPVTDEARLAAIRSKVIGKLYAAADISFSKDGEEIEPSAEVEVQIAMDGLDDIKNPSVVHVRDDGNVEYVEAELVNVNRSGSQKALRFRASRFSVYAVIGDGESSSLKTVTISFYVRKNGATGGSDSENDWQIINRQKLRLDQLTDPDNDSPIYDPGVPDMTTTQSFEGWFYNNGGFTESDTGETMDVINARAKEYAAQSTTSEDESWDFYAMVYNVVYIQYHDQNGAIVRTDYEHLDARTGKASVDIDEEYVPFKSYQTFSGWVTEDKVASKGDNPTYNTVASDDVYQVGGTYTIDGTLELYPYLQKGYWMSFNNNIAKNSDVLGFEDNTSAEYISPKFYAEGVAPGSRPLFPAEQTTPADPTKIRPGYTFINWYADPEMTTLYDFTKPLTADTTVYAKWNPAATTYRVVFWQQKPTDSINAYDTKEEGTPVKAWDYYVPSSVSVERTATTGELVSLSSDDKRLGNRNNSTTNYGEMGYFFDFNTNLSTNGSVRVLGDGSTVLDAYYNRKVITINFRTAWTAVQYDSFESVGYDSSIGYYRWNIYFYVDETHRDGSGTSSNILTLTAPEGSGYPDADGKVYAGYLYSTYDNINTAYNNNRLYIKTNGSQCVWKRNGTTYTGDVYGLNMNADASATSPIWYTYQGLYKAKLYWPGGTMTSNSWYIDYVEDGSTYALTPRDNSDIMDAKYTTVYDLYLKQETESNPKTIHWMKEKSDSDDYTGVNKYEEAFATVINDNFTSQSYTINKFQGFSAYGHNLTRNSLTNGFVQPTTEANMKLSYSSMGSNSYIYYNRNRYHLSFVSNGRTLVYNSSDPKLTIPASYPDPNAVAYEKPLSDYVGFVPANGPDGYYFVGWYADPGYSREFDFNSESMPYNDVTVYAKWNPKWYRIEVDYKRGNDCTITLPGTTQTGSFTVKYGGKIQASALMKAKRVDADGNNNWLLVGLFLDEACTKPFNENMLAPLGLTEAQEVYPDEERTGIDQVTGNNWTDIGYPDIRAKIKLYALWRQDPEGTIGIDVTYLGDHSETDTGYFDVNQNPKPHIWRDESQLYTDQAKAYAHAASIPETAGEQFLYWEILDSEGEPTGRKVYPGGTWTVNLADAAMVREKLPDPRCPHTTREAVEAVEPTCTEAGNNAYFVCTACGKKFRTNDPADVTEYDPTVPALDHNWGEWTVTQGKEPTCLAQGEESRACSRCDAVQTRAAAALGHNVEGVAYSYDASGHWQICARCGARVNEAEHTLEEDMSQYVAPTATSAGQHVYKCTACDYSETETIPAIHEVTVTFAVPEAVNPVPAQTVESNTAITLPTASAPSGYTFLGWIENDLSETTEEPTDVLDGGSSYTVEDTITLHALYSRTVEGEAVTCYQQVSTQPDSWVGNYVLSYLNNENAFVMDRVTGGSTYESEGTGVALSSAGITLQGDKLYNVADRYVFRIAAQGNYFSMQNASNNTYVGRYVTSTAKSAKLQSYSTYSATYCRWSFAVQSGGNVQILNNYSSSYDTNYPYIGFGTEASCFWVDGLGSAANGYTNANSNMYLWKETTERPSTTYYSTEIGGYTVSFSVPANVAAVSPLSCIAGGSVTLPAANAPEGYSFRGWVTDTVNNSNEAPDVVYAANSSYQPQSSITLKALYSYNGGGSGETVYQRLSEAPSDWTGSYVITYGSDASYVFTALSAEGTYEKTAGATALASSGITLDGDYLRGVGNTYVFTVGTGITDEGYENCIYLRNDAYVSYPSFYKATTTSYTSLWNYTTDDHFYQTAAWDPSFNTENGNVVLKNHYYASETYAYFSFSESNQYFWSGSETGDGTNGIYFWKQTTLGTTYYTTEINGAGNNGNEDADSQELIGTSEAVTGLQNEAQSAAQDQTDAQVGTVVDVSGKSTENGTTPKGADQGGDGTNAVTVDRYYVEVTKPIPGEKYLITYQYGTTLRALLNESSSSNFYKANQMYPYFVTLTQTTTNGKLYLSSNSVDLNSLLYTVGGSASEGFTFQSTLGGYLGFTNGGATCIGQLNGNYSRWYWNHSEGNGLLNKEWYENTHDSDYFAGYSTTNNCLTYSSSGTSNFHFYKPIDLEVPSAEDNIVYRRVSAITPGKQYVIVSKGYAATATAYDTSSNRALASVAVSVSGEYVTVPASSVDSVLWYVDGNDSDGYTFLNLSSNKYLSLNENDLYWLAPLSTGWAWTYNDNDLDNHCVESGNTDDYGSFYRYLYVASANQFSTSVSPNQGIQLYERVVSSVASHKLTIHYVYEGGVTARQDYETFVEENVDYEVESPSINGYTPDIAVVSGTMRTQDVEVTVTYSPKDISGTARTVTVVDEDGNPVEGFPSFQIEDGGKISFENEPSREDYYFLGWFQDGGDEEFDFDTPIHSDITLVAKFSYMWKVSYTITLRAVYGMRNETGDTHVYWYANDGTNVGYGEGAGDRYESRNDRGENHIALNTPVPIPTPANWEGNQTGVGLYRQGYTFLGWARMPIPEESTGVIGQGYPELTADSEQFYLRWDGSQYWYLPSNDGITSEQLNGGDPNVWRTVDKIYADEGRPYHDMYAVWAPGNFYIYHSATGKLEAVSYLAVKNSSSGRINLSNHVTPGYLYGGYYLDDPDTTKQNRLSGYGYITAAEMSQIVKNYETGASANAWASLDHAQPDDAVAVHVVADAEVDNANFGNYDGMARYVGGGFYPYTDKDGNIVRDSNNKLVLTEPIWNSAFAGTARGTRLEPEAGKVYYLKEVPSTYLSSKVLYTYDTTSATNVIQDVWIVTLVDDNNYRRVGFKTVDGQDAEAIQEIRALMAAETVAKSFTLRPKTPAGGGTPLPATKVTAKNFGFSKDEAGYVAVTRRTDLVNGGQPDFTMLPGWVTFDGVQVCDNGMNWKYVEGADADKQLTWARTFNGTEKLYIDMSKGAGVGDGWTGANAVIKFMFYDAEGNNSGYVDTRATGDGSIYEVTVPTGNWSKFLVKRMKPDGTGEWDSTGDIPLNQDMTADQFQDGADIASNVNLIDWFEKNNTHVHWGYYPAFPS